MNKYLNYIKNQRGLPFVKKGMKVQLTYNEKTGIIVGANLGGNLNVQFEGQKHYENVHPTWSIKYYDANGNILAEFPE